ncbi:MAG: energy transducer TonB, partial [Lewinella sp.]|nr:energy transducer TonB [Lewinella sp.]
EEEAKKAAEESKKRAEEEAKKKAAEEAARKKAEAEAEKKRQEQAAKEFGESLGLEGLGKGKGDSGKAGNKGDPNGDPNSSNLEGISKGSGSVGGGLGSRGVLNSPAVQENSQQAGTVVLEVCVDTNGNVIEAKYTQKGSTTGNSQLVNAAIANAKRWRFSKGSIDKQCGTITYNFKVQ